MKKLTILIILAAFLMGCRKENANEDKGNCSGATYEVKISEINFDPIDIDEDGDGNVIILGSNYQNPVLLKFSTTGEFLWSKEIQTENIAKDLLVLNDNSLVVLFKGESEVNYTETTPENIWLQNSIMGVETCIPTYELGTVTCYTLSGTIEINKYTLDGEQVWNKTLNDFSTGGSSLVNKSENSFMLLSADMYGLQPDYVYDSTGVFMDTVNFPLDSNKIRLYEFDYDGETNWQSEIEGIFNTSWDSDFMPPVDMIYNGDVIQIKTINSIISVSNTGEELSRLDLFPEFCIKQNYYMVSCTENSYVVSGICYTGIIPDKFFTKYIDYEGNTIWQKDEALHLLDGSNGYFATHKNGTLDLLNIQGSILWSIQGINLKRLLINCNNGITFIHQKDQNEYYLVRTDENGNYNKVD